MVTGASGTLGGWVAALAQPGWDVTATYHSGGPAHGDEGVAWRQLDIGDEVQVVRLMTELRPDAVIHTAALSQGDRTDLERVNVGGTRHVARAASSRGARLVHISTDLVFDGRKGSYVEPDPPAPITEYGRSKALAEEEVRNAAGEAVIVRTSLIYSWKPKLDRHSRWLLERASAGERIDLFTDERRSPIWVESLAQAAIELVGLEYTGVLHVAGAQVLSRHEHGLRLLRFHGLDQSPIVAGLSADSGLLRPLDCTLDCCRALALLETPLPGVDDVLSANMGQPRPGP